MGGSAVSEEKQEYSPTNGRLAMGEAWMMCEECGAKLYSFAGTQDASRPCPKMRNGKCVYGEEQ